MPDMTVFMNNLSKQRELFIEKMPQIKFKVHDIQVEKLENIRKIQKELEISKQAENLEKKLRILRNNNPYKIGGNTKRKTKKPRAKPTPLALGKKGTKRARKMRKKGTKRARKMRKKAQN
jgi:hypothetical protein